MKVSWNINPKKLGDNLLKEVKAVMPKVLEAFSKEVEDNARRNFNREIIDISGDNPYIVVSRKVSNNQATISCSGEQVLFAEFGAGIFNSAKEIDIEGYTATTPQGTTYTVKGYSKIIPLKSRGFTNSGTKDLFPRPNGIDELGHYRFHRYKNGSMGMNYKWVRHTDNGRIGSNEELDRNGRTDIVWTKGTRPVRGLWRARNTAINKLDGGRLKIK